MAGTFYYDCMRRHLWLPRPLCRWNDVQTNQIRDGNPKIGYYGMLLESFLALCVVIAVIMSIDMYQYRQLVLPVAGSKFQSNPILAFALAMGRPLHSGLGLPLSFGILFGMLLLEGFIVT